MEVIKSSNFNEINIGPMVLAVGTFDGMHLGHQAVINKAKKIGKELKIPVGVYTFNPHPLKILKPAIAPKNIVSSRQKIELLSSFDLDYYLEQKFTIEFAATEFSKFVNDYLIEKFKMKHLVVGEDFHLGNKGEGNLSKLKTLGKALFFDVTGIKNIKNDSERISSTLIRQLIEKGKVNKFDDYLGRNYRLDAKIIRGMGRGQKLGFPTANLNLEEDYVLPLKGVYACYVYYNEKKHKGLVNFGNKPTFAGSNYSIEVHILDFEYKELYSEKIAIELLDYIRDEMTFSSSEELVKQIRKDILYTQNLLWYN